MATYTFTNHSTGNYTILDPSGSPAYEVTTAPWSQLSNLPPTTLWKHDQVTGGRTKVAEIQWRAFSNDFVAFGDEPGVPMNTFLVMPKAFSLLVTQQHYLRTKI